MTNSINRQKIGGGGKNKIVQYLRKNTDIIKLRFMRLCLLTGVFSLYSTFLSCEKEVELQLFDLLQGQWHVYAMSTPEMSYKHDAWQGTYCVVTADSLKVYVTETCFDFNGNRKPDIVTPILLCRITATDVSAISIDGSDAIVKTQNDSAIIRWGSYALWMRRN